MRTLRISFAAIAVAFAMQAPAQAQSLEKPHLTLALAGTAAQIDFLPLNVAQGLGYLKEEGLTVETVDAGSGAKAMQALVGGSADVDVGSYEHTIQLQSRGQIIRMVTLMRRATGIAVVVGAGKADEIKSPKDLKGKIVGVSSPGSSTHIFLNLLLAQAGLQASDVSVVGVGTGSVAIAAIKAGKIDALSTIDPTITMVTRGGDAKVLYDTRTEEGTKAVYGGQYASVGLMFTDAFIKANPKSVQALVNAMVRAMIWIQKNDVNAIMKVLPANVVGADPQVYAEALKNSFYTVSTNGNVTTEAAENVMKVVLVADPAVAKTKIDLALTYDNSFVEKALAKYGK